MARWHRFGDVYAEYRWFGRWVTPVWLDLPQVTNRWVRRYRHEWLSDWLRRWAVTLHEVG